MKNYKEEEKNLYKEEEIDNYVFKALEKQKSDFIKILDKKMLKTKGERPDVAMWREGYNARVKEEWDILEVLNKK